MTDASWKVLAAAKKADTLANIPPEWILDSASIEKHRENILEAPEKLLTAKEFVITQQSGTALSQQLALGELSAVEVAKAFMHRAAIATQLTNCATEIFFRSGLTRAKELDEYLKEHGKPVGPFHGLPISIKDSFNVKGVDSTLGYVALIGNADKLHQSVLTDILLEAGAVLYIKTNIPQTLMTADSENNIFGRTLNPNNPKLTAGGLSGGEGALVRQHGSVFGVGTDIAGSIRIPSACCGTYGFKPSTNRIPYIKQTDGGEPKYLGITASAGPLANTFGDLKFFFREILNAKPWNFDFTALALPYVETHFERELVIGVILEDKSFPVHPPIRKNLEDAAKILEDAGHKVLRLEAFPDFDDAWRVAFAQFCIKVENEPTSLDPLIKAGEPFIKSLGQSGIEHYAPKVPSTIKEVVDLFRQGAKIAEKWHKLFQEYQLDVLLTPVAPSSAPPHDTYGIAPYTSVWNLVNYPALAIPFGVTQGNYEEDLSRYPKHLQGIYAHYENEVYQGGIGSIQVVAPTNMDEKLLAAGEIIDSILNKV